MFLLLACASPEVLPENVSVEVDDVIPTLVHVRWSTAEPVMTEVISTLPEDPAVTIPGSTTPASSHAVDLYPLPAGTTVDLVLRNLTEDGTELGRSTRTLDLAKPPEELASVAEVQIPEDPPTPYLLVASVNADTGLASVQVVDWHGRAVWWVPPDNTYAGFARPRADGGGVYIVTNWMPDGAVDAGAVGLVDWDGTTKLWPAPHIHHDVVELPDGRVGVAGWVNEEMNGEPIAGEQVMIVGPSGPEATVWNAFDHLPVVENRCWDMFDVNGAKDSIHLNGLDYDGSTDRWLLSLYCQESVLAVDGATGDTVWAVGGEVGELTLVGDEGFGPQHAPRWTDEGFRIFDNSMDVAAGSRVVTYAVDSMAGTATRVDEWRAPDAGYTGVLGESNDYGDGQLVSIGFDGSIFWHDADGAVVGELVVEPGETVGSVEGVAGVPLGDRETTVMERTR